MANFSLYVSGQTELNDVTEFFQKRLMHEGENPIAFFDGVFYESHQERVGNIVFQDYLIYTDKAVYLWARGATKDYLDRFNLGTVSVNSRNKDSDFATLNIKIRREEKEPIYVIFDMVEIRESETITRLHTVIEATIEDFLGVNYRKEIPQEISSKILQSARNICPPQSFTVPFDAGGKITADSQIGYGQDLLEQYKASIGYNLQDEQPPGPAQGSRESRRGRQGGTGIPGPQDALKNIEAMLPTDPAALKRIAGSIKDMVGDAPFKLRDQVMKDLQHIPNDVATVLTAVNELLANIADNPQAERFVMNAIKTAVRNDGVLGSLGKIFKLTSGMGGGGPKKQSHRPQPSHHEDDGPRKDRHSNADDDSNDDNTIRRKKINIKADDAAGGYDPFRDDEIADALKSPAPDVPNRNKRIEHDDDDPDSGIRRKKISIKADENSGSGADIARKLMSYEEPADDEDITPVKSKPVAGDDAVAEGGIRKKKISIKTEENGGSGTDIARKLMSYDESAGEQNDPAEDEPSAKIAPLEEPVPEIRRKKIAIKTETADDPAVFPEEMLAAALNEQQPVSGVSEYLTIESDDPAAATSTKSVSEEKSLQGPEEENVPGIDAAQSSGLSDQPASRKNSVKVKSTQ
jgi:hypothetical protein